MKISDIIIFDQCSDSNVAIVSVLLNMINYFHGEYRGIRKISCSKQFNRSFWHLENSNARFLWLLERVGRDERNYSRFLRKKV